MAKQDWRPGRRGKPPGYIIVGWVRRGGGEPQESSWTGTSWSRRRALVYRRLQDAEAAAGRIDIRPVESIAIFPAEWRTGER